MRRKKKPHKNCITNWNSSLRSRASLLRRRSSAGYTMSFTRREQNKKELKRGEGKEFLNVSQWLNVRCTPVLISLSPLDLPQTCITMTTLRILGNDKQAALSTAQDCFHGHSERTSFYWECDFTREEEVTWNYTLLAAKRIYLYHLSHAQPCYLFFFFWSSREL